MVVLLTCAFSNQATIAPHHQIPPLFPRQKRISSALSLRHKYPCTLVFNRSSTSVSIHESSTSGRCIGTNPGMVMPASPPSTACHRAGVKLGQMSPMNKARKIMRNPPQIAVRGVKSQPSRVECKVLAAQMACKENQQRCDALLSCTPRHGKV